MRAIVWTTPAEHDLEEIDDYWLKHNPERADAILDVIEAAGNFLTTMPHAGPAVHSLAARKWSVSTTDYVLVYRVHVDRIEVLRVHHARQDWFPS
ncbi:type II toxin-antitoxin system RelE/ParE family toxin [Sphingobium boeckii]|uniref:Plasmid stabilization system protein ParE n=1 Tax=Sphingobium boeckii TaxID=1082345 RepID=A0A7W9EEF3_9SPHN|nr:plasmid stabilization system protein ParE [Sphingobium boeckii]